MTDAVDVLRSFPWLAQLPGPLLHRLDWAEFRVPTETVAQAIERLQAATGHLVMSYRRGLIGRVDHGAVQLCELIEPATISAADAVVLAELEGIVAAHGACLVLYRNPLRLSRPGAVCGQWPPV
nr:hypothetical protein [Kibdelosporangium sp. MJ126-NF4]CEL15610.1 hypothetical protein [Kibdelosporangium sp. MJ126-NF4]CTQ98274.1 hypothetical protein [Kibdelosporangium sp. MJ126-NF4]